MAALPSLPVEIQMFILQNVFYSTPASGSNRYTSPPAFPRSPVHNFHLAAAFLSASTAPSSPRIVEAGVPKCTICSITDPLSLRAALAFALPAWRSALCGIPELWSRIGIPIDAETWGPAVLDAVKEALKCSQDELLAILITRAPAESGTKAASEGDGDSGAGERARVAEVMALLTPRLKRWLHLRVCTWHAEALPVPGLHFAGKASRLEQLHLRAKLTPRVRRAPGGLARSLKTPILHTLTVDAHVFRAAYLRVPNALPVVKALKICGPGVRGENLEGPAAMSVREMLACVSQMSTLVTLWVSGAHLGLRCEEHGAADEDGHSEPPLPTPHPMPPLPMTILHCARLPAAILAKVLKVARHHAQPGQAPAEGGPPQAFRELEVAECALPKSPPLEAYTVIQLARIPACEDIGMFLARARLCRELVLAGCEWLPPAVLTWPPSPSPSPPPEEPHQPSPQEIARARVGYVLPRLLDLSVDKCVYDDPRMQDMLKSRQRPPNLAGFTRVRPIYDRRMIYVENEESDDNDED